MTKTESFRNDYESVLPPHYRLIEMIGRGGMAEVFLARDERLNRNVAIKFLNSEFRRDPDRMKRFTQEARAASSLNHPNILVIHDIGEGGEDGVQYIVSEHVDGEPLSSRIRRGKIPLPEAVDIALQIASALAASHKAGIVHRDMKPDNVMIRKDGTVKVLDFGLAKESVGGVTTPFGFEANTLARSPTSPGLVLGTPQYMSPEQARGLHLDGRTDIFSLGIIIFEMVTGRSPFAGSDNLADIIAAIIGKEPRRLEEYLHDPPLALIRIVQKALRKDRNERYATADHLVSDLRDLKQQLADQQYTSGRETGRSEIRKTLHDSILTAAAARLAHPPPALLLVGIAAVAVLIWAGWWHLGRGGSSRQEPPAGGAQASMRTVAITSWSSSAGELISAASFSPDANMVAFAAVKSKATEIWAKPTVGGDPIQVTRNGFYNQYPVWSPDGQQIAFFSSRGADRGIWRASFTGGAQTQITGGVGATARPVYWGKQGKIYFQEGSELFAVDERSGERRQVTKFESKGIKPRTIEIAADESAIAYSIKEGDLWRVKIQRLDAETAPADEIATSKDQIDNLAWQPNGRAVVYSSSVDGAYQVFEAGVDRTGPVQLSNGNLDFFVHDVASDGSKILYGSVSETSDLWTVNTDDATESLVANDVEAEYWADLSPDGKSVAFQSVRQVDRPFAGSVKVVSRGGSGGATPAVVVSNRGFSPIWSKSGRWIAFFRRDEDGIALYRSKPTGDDTLKLAGGGVTAPGYTATPYLKIGVNHADWSPGDDFVAYSAAASTDGASNIWLAASDGSRNTPVTQNTDPAETFCCPTWSKDGRYLIFLSELATKQNSPQKIFRLWLHEVDGQAQRVVVESKERFRFLGFSEDRESAVLVQKADPSDLSSTPESTDVYLHSLTTGARKKVNSLGHAYFHNIHLSADGSTIAFVSRRDDTTVLWTVPVEGGGAPKRLLVANDPKILISSLAWAPDGRSIVFGKQTRTSLLSMLTK